MIFKIILFRVILQDDPYIYIMENILIPLQVFSVFLNYGNDSLHALITFLHNVNFDVNFVDIGFITFKGRVPHSPKDNIIPKLESSHEFIQFSYVFTVIFGWVFVIV